MDDKFAVSGSSDKSIRIWDLQNGQCLNVFEGHHNKISALAISTLNNFVVSCSADYTVRIW